MRWPRLGVPTLRRDRPWSVRTCGHVELRVANPGQLYQHYLKSLDQEPLSDA